MTISLDEQITDVKREIAMRKNAYPKWVKDGRMKQEQADYRIEAMTAVLHTLMNVKQLAIIGDEEEREEKAAHGQFGVGA